MTTRENTRKSLLWCLAIVSSLCITSTTPAQPEVLLRMIPPLETLELDQLPEEIVLIARVNIEGVQFAWTMQGPGAFEGDVASRKVFYRPPAHLATASAEVVITVTATDEQGESTQEQVMFTLHDPNPQPPDDQAEITPTVAVEETPVVRPDPQVGKLLRTADAYFDRTFYTEPENNNALSFYQQALELDPQNEHARARIRKMADDYKMWAETAENQNNEADAQRYYDRYLFMAAYIVEELGDQTILDDLNAVHLKLKGELYAEVSGLSQPTPTPTPTPTVHSEPTPTATTPSEPTPTSTVSPEPTQTAETEIDDDLMQRPGNLYAVVIGAGSYQDAALAPMPTAERNAKALAQLLTDADYGGIPDEQLRLLRGDEATEYRVKHAVGVWAREQASVDDAVLVYYAGQGRLAQESSYWLTYDADADDLYATTMNQADIVDMFARLRTERLMVLFDAVYEPANGQMQAANDPALPWKRLAEDSGAMIVAAAGNLFAETLRQGLEGQADENDDGAIDAAEVWTYLEQALSSDSSAAGPQLYGQPLSDVPVTFDAAKLREIQDARDAEERTKAFEAKQQKLIEIYRSGTISADHFKKALDILKSETYDQILEDFLDGTLPVEIFNETF